MDLNPFDLRGPEFLVLYAAVAAIITYFVWALRRYWEQGTAEEVAQLAQHVAEDPYQIACVRGGRLELLRVAVVSLLERGLLNADGELLAAASDAAADKVRHPLDKMLLLMFAAPTKAYTLFNNRGVMVAARSVEDQLRQQQLLSNMASDVRRTLLAGAAVGFLWLLSLIKIGVALGRGRTNIGFLAVLTLVATVTVIAVVFRARTTLGNQVCEDLNRRFQKLRRRRLEFHMGRTTSELTFLAAVFGLTLLPSDMSGFVKPLKLAPDDSSWRNAGQSSCSALWSGSSCGGGGGGGGCGGGGGGGCGGGGCGGCGG